MTLGTLGAGGSCVTSAVDGAGAAGSLSLFTSDPKLSTHSQKIDGLEDCLNTGRGVSLGQNASSIVAEVLSRVPRFLLVERLEA